MGFESWACPRCRGRLTPQSQNLLACESCRESFASRAGIWHFLNEHQRRYYGPFLEDYDKIRLAEGRSSSDPEFYRQLPHRDLSGNFSDEWRIRAASFRELGSSVIKPRIESQQGTLIVADLGAGNCWLSHRLSQLGVTTLAVDLRTDPLDGLGCHIHYPDPIIPIETEFSRLPVETGCLDLVIFNASLHYTEDLEQTLSEGCRVLGPTGQLVILDSPVYRQADSGRQMVKEREQEFRLRFGTASNHLGAQHFLTWDGLNEMADKLGLSWACYRPSYGLSWRLRPFKARCLGRREPAVFAIFVGSRR